MGLTGSAEMEQDQKLGSQEGGAQLVVQVFVEPLPFVKSTFDLNILVESPRAQAVGMGFLA